MVVRLPRNKRSTLRSRRRQGNKLAKVFLIRLGGIASPRQGCCKFSKAFNRDLTLSALGFSRFRAFFAEQPVYLIRVEADDRLLPVDQ